MKNFNLLSIELLSIEELAAVKGGYNVPTPVIIVDTIVSETSNEHSNKEFGIANAAANILKDK